MTDVQPPEDEPRSEDAAAESEPAASATPEPPASPEEHDAPAEEPAAAEPVAEEAPAPAAETPAEEAPAPAAEAPAAAEPPAATEEPTAAAEQPAAAAEQPAPAAEQPPAEVVVEVEVEVEVEGEDLTPRQKPEIPGADLIPDIVTDGDQFLDAEAQAAAEAEAEAAAARAAESDQVEESKPIADAAINLAAGARYTATGKRKTAVARVIIKPGSGTYTINGKTLEDFFPRETLQRVIRQPLEAVGYDARMDVVARMHGGGVAAQAGALRHGISRALIVADPNLRGELKRRGFLTRDPRVKERKKAGLKKARKRPQFSKR